MLITDQHSCNKEQQEIRHLNRYELLMGEEKEDRYAPQLPLT